MRNPPFCLTDLHSTRRCYPPLNWRSGCGEVESFQTDRQTDGNSQSNIRLLVERMAAGMKKLHLRYSIYIRDFSSKTI